MILEKKIGKIFGLHDEEWLNHANPISVWTRFIILPFLALSIWSRVWLGWLALLPIGLIIIWAWVNPQFFKKPKNTNHWASKCVLGEKMLANRDKVPIPPSHLSATRILTIIQLIGSVSLIYGLYTFHFWLTIVGIILVYMGKMWFLDRMVWLFEDMKEHSEYKNLKSK